jgi:hypothetical protein
MASLEVGGLINTVPIWWIQHEYVSCVVTLWLRQKNTTFKAMQDNVCETYWTAREQRIKTAELKNSLPENKARSLRRQKLLFNCHISRFLCSAGITWKLSNNSLQMKCIPEVSVFVGIKFIMDDCSTKTQWSTREHMWPTQVYKQFKSYFIVLDKACNIKNTSELQLSMSATGVHTHFEVTQEFANTQYLHGKAIMQRNLWWNRHCLRRFAPRSTMWYSDEF